MKKTVIYAIGCAIIALQIYAIVKIWQIQIKVDVAYNAINNTQNNISGQIAQVYENVDEKLLEQQSNVFNATIKIGNLNTSNYLVPVTFIVEPKNITETMKVFLGFEDKEVELKKQGVKFAYSTYLPLQGEFYPTIIMQDNDNKWIERHGGLMVSNLGSDIFFQDFSFDGQTSYNANEFSIKGNINIDMKEACQANRLTSLQYIVKIDDEIIKKADIDYQSLESDGFISTNVDEKFAIKQGQVLTASVVAKDSQGYTYDTLVIKYDSNGKNASTDRFTNRTVTAPTGEVIYKFE